MTCGIYMIQNLVNFKIYIGQSLNIEDRWRQHRSELRGNDHDNKHLQRAWNKYKEDNFEFTIICECDESQLNTKEIDYIAKLKTYDRDFGYNKTYGGEGGRPTEETKRKQSEAQKGENNHFYGKHLSEETRRKLSIPIVQVDPSTDKVVNVWGSSMDAERECGYSNSCINQCCKGKRITHGGYKWQYLHVYMQNIDPRIWKVILFGKE